LLVDEPVSAKTLGIEEIDKLAKQFQNKLLNFLESRRIKFEINE
jgi:MoxR-like ATPase